MHKVIIADDSESQREIYLELFEDYASDTIVDEATDGNELTEKVKNGKYDLIFDGWVSDEIGSICLIADYFFDFHDIKYCVDNDISFDWLSDWYYFCADIEKVLYNLDSYSRLRRDIEYKYGFNFNLKEFEKYLLKLRLKSENNEK